MEELDHCGVGEGKGGRRGYLRGVTILGFKPGCIGNEVC